MIDPLSPSWVHLEAWANSRLQSLREENDAPCDEAKTSFRRGQIALLREFLKLPDQERIRIDIFLRDNLP